MAAVDLGRYRRIVQIFWDPEPTNDYRVDLPVWCLGRSYNLSTKAGKEKGSRGQTPPTTDTASSQTNANNPSPVPPALGPETPPDSVSSSFSSSLAYDDDYSVQDGGWPAAFLDDFESKFWMTYRSDFELIAKSTDPRASSALSLSMRIKSQLVDQSGFSSDSGWGCMIRSGQMLLANAMAITNLGREQPSLRVYSTGDGPDVYEDKFMKIAKPDGTRFHPTLILVGTRLGIDKITPVYWDALIAALQMPQSVGIAGGRPSASHYFIGAQGSFLFYLDPHHTRPALPYHSDPSRYTDADIDTAHTRRLRRLHVREMDPSMLIGFLIKDDDDWSEWRRNVKHVQGKAVIHVADNDPVAGVGSKERESAIDEVETLSDDDGDTILDV
ncbi:putative cysteine protease ATG4 [Colletotrichum siamense]|uniref:putative cysteine protease ATG4 n=1 Tax=Colletotrichum siamense TaxID=690259 RepID=UPI001872E9B5|nr:putative cysteine protease ATG4 [Colletotrichum siamense]KAF4823794.1 putative cysteine protease ATG4 [Colletotrichum siamense]KAF5494334.1 putative cysteine protease ATG4 [Colletotrichum siamense]